MERPVLAVLEDDVQVLRGLDEAVVFHDVGVVQVLEQVDLLHERGDVAGEGEVGERDLFDGDGFAGRPVEGAVDGAEGAAAEAVA